MGRAKLPEARIEPRGVEGHLAKLKADARQHARTAGAVGVFLARVVGWTAFAASTVALLVWLAPPPRNTRLDEIRRIQSDLARSQANLEQARRALEQMQHVNEIRLRQDLQRIQPTWPPEPSASYSLPTATHAERARVR